MRFCLPPIACCLFIVFSSCKSKIDYSKEISQLDSAETRLKATEKVFLAADTTSLRSAYDSAQKKLNSIGEIISKDTVTKNTAIFLSAIYEQTGNIRNLLENKNDLKKAVKDSRERISNLKHDLTENLIEQNKSAGYIVNEINASQKVCETADKAIEKAKAAAIKLDSMKTRIEFIADSLNSK